MDGLDGGLVKWLERLAVNAKVATVLGSILSSCDTVESQGRRMMQFWITYIEKEKNLKILILSVLFFSISAIEMAKSVKQSAHRKFYNLPDNGPPDSADPSKQEDLLQIIQYINNSIIGTVC